MSVYSTPKLTSNMNHQLTTAIFLILSFLSLISSQTLTDPTSCPLNFDYVGQIKWPTTDCQSPGPTSSCCQTLLSVFGISLAQHLKDTSQFHLSNLKTSSSCLSNFQNKLTSLSLSTNLTSYCFNPTQFVISTNTCAGIQTLEDWREKLGNETILDSTCGNDLSDLSACDACGYAALTIQKELIAIDGNTSHSNDCFYFIVLYSAGVVNEFGPQSNSAVTCNFDINVLPKSNKDGNSSLIFGLIGGFGGVLVISCFAGLFFWWDRKKKRGNINEFESSLPRRRPNTGSQWFKFLDLQKATDNFSENNLIGRGGFGVVYKGVLSDGSVVAVKKIIESEFGGTDDFCNEVEIISKLRHRNLVPLIGCCIHGEDEDYERRDDQRFLLYEYMSNGNLDDHLFQSMTGKPKLTWAQRKNIILDVAKGLTYLHYGVKPDHESRRNSWLFSAGIRPLRPIDGKKRCVQFWGRDFGDYVWEKSARFFLLGVPCFDYRLGVVDFKRRGCRAGFGSFVIGRWKEHVTDNGEICGCGNFMRSCNGCLQAYDYGGFKDVGRRYRSAGDS